MRLSPEVFHWVLFILNSRTVRFKTGLCKACLYGYMDILVLLLTKTSNLIKRNFIFWQLPIHIKNQCTATTYEKTSIGEMCRKNVIAEEKSLNPTDNANQDRNASQSPSLMC